MDQLKLTPLYPLDNKRLAVAFVLFFLFAFVPCLSARDIAKKDVLADYEKAVQLAEELNVYQHDTYNVIPKIRVAAEALLKDDIPSASRVLEQVLDDLRVLQSEKPKKFDSAVRLEWLEIYTEIFRKLAFLILLAFLFVKWPFMHSMLKQDQVNLAGKLALPFVIGGAAVLISFYDMTKYGESAWAFFDLQIVFIVISGLLGGFWTGLACGIFVGLFRWMLKPEFFIYFGTAILAGALSGYLAQGIKTFRSAERQSFVIGLYAGIVHGIAIYSSTFRLIPWFFFAFTVLFLAFLEGVAVFIFFAVVSGVLREEKRREVENELLKTRLLFLQAQMSPHFLFNALNTISAICSRENAAQAQNLVISLARFLRRTLKRADEKVSLREEMEYIDSYLEIEKARFQDRLKVEKELDLKEESWNAMIPLLILQPLVENAVKHGIGKKESGGTLKIKAEDQSGSIRVRISDDGAGMTSGVMEHLFDTSNTSGEGAGIGIKNIQQRLTHLYGPEGGLYYESAPGQGTVVTLSIPCRKGDPA